MPAEYVPTAEQRALVESAAAFGLTQADIAEQLGICEKTLRKHFRDELSGGVFKANMKVGGNMYALTQSADEQVRLRFCLPNDRICEFMPPTVITLDAA